MGRPLRRLLAAGMVVVVAFSFIAPLMVVPHAGEDSRTGNHAFESAVTFPTPLNTSATVPEYPLVSRALMLPGGSTDSALADLNGDSRTDLVVAVSGSKSLAVFLRQPSNGLLSTPSLTIPLSREPVSVAIADILGFGVPQIIVLERRNTAFDSDHLEFYNVTSSSTYQLFMDAPPLSGSTQILVGNLTEDAYPDVVMVSPGSNPSTVAGKVEVLKGPYFNDSVMLAGGLGSGSIALLDANDDGLQDIAVANFYDSSVLVYHQQFSDFMPASQVLAVVGNPAAISSGRLDADSFDDLVLSTYNQSMMSGSLRFFFQSLSHLSVTESLNVTLTLNPSRIDVADTNGDGIAEVVLALSQTGNVAAGLLRKATAPVWRAPADVQFPTGWGPRTARFGSFDSTGEVGVALSSARSDGSGSSIEILPDILKQFSNSNGTLWTNRDVRSDSVCTGDIDDDGATDLILRHSAANAFGYMLSAGGSGTIALGYAPSHLIVEDLNGDGYDDILTTSTGNKSRIYFGSPTGLADPLWLVSTGNVTDLSVGDLNHDSLPDIVTATGNQDLNVYFNRGTPSLTFGIPYVVTVGTVPQALSIGDFDSDGRDDIAYSHATRAISILLQKDADPFIYPTADLNLSASTGADFDKIWSGDITGDGAADLVGEMPGVAKLYLFDQTDFITSPHPYATLDFPEVPHFVSVMDATDDGHADVVATFDSADLLFLYRQSAGGLPAAPSMTFVTGADPNWVTFGDGTGDGRSDLLVNNADSHSVSAWETINTPPKAVAGGPYSGFEGDPISLLGSAITQISEMPITDFYWDFGDGNNSGWSHSGTASHVYELQQTYNATLTVRDPFNPTFVNSSSTTVVVSDGFPHVSFNYFPSSPIEGQLVQFNDTSTSFDAVVMYNWTIDGTVVYQGLNRSISQRLDDGAHVVTLQVIDSDGSANSSSRSVSVGRVAPTVSISSPSVASEGTPVGFAAVVDEWHRTVDFITSYEWNFSYSSGPFVSQISTGTVNHTTHVFQSAGADANYTVAVKVTDVDGDIRVAFTNISIYDVPVVAVTAVNPGQLYEWRKVNLTVDVDSAFGAVSFEWDFDAPQNGFQADTMTALGEANNTYVDEGNYLVKVRVLMSNGSYALGSTYITVSDLGLAGTADDLTVSRNPSQTNNIFFDASALASRFQDINHTVWNFGDSSVKESSSGPSGIVNHTFNATANYVVTLTLTDDDGNTLILQKTMKLVAPVIELWSPDSGSVVRSGTILQYSISDDSQSFVSVRYMLDGGGYLNFSSQWKISTDGWAGGPHVVRVMVEDPDGNIAYSSATMVTIDDTAPKVTVTSSVALVYGGSKMNFTASVDDPNIASGGVLLYLKFPGDKTFASFPMAASSGGEYYRVIEVPLRAGEIEYYVQALDKANNSAQTTTVSVQIKLHLMDFVLPYLLVATVLLMLGTAGYFMHETRNAVDETFVVYNDGRLISHSTRRLKPGMDDQILSGMLAAIQDFVRESFKDVTSFNIRRLEFGDKNVLIEKGDNLFLAVILHGKASRKIASRMRRVVGEIEDRFEADLTDWDGDLDRVRGVTDIVKKLYSKAPLVAASFKRRDT